MGGHPQQPEIERHGLGEVDQEGRAISREDERERRSSGRTGPVPPENRPGHHPEHEQDKPEGPPLEE
jgi:hypothetical protein